MADKVRKWNLTVTAMDEPSVVMLSKIGKMIEDGYIYGSVDDASWWLEDCME